MMLILLLLIPLLAGLLCMATRTPASWERLNLLAFALLVPVALKVVVDVLERGSVSALKGFLRADALSALVIGLTAFVALACAIYAVGYFRHDARAGRITDAQLRHYYVLTPLFVAVMLLVPLADNLGVMWVATEGTTLASVLLVTFYNQKLPSRRAGNISSSAASASRSHYSAPSSLTTPPSGFSERTRIWG
jgi:hydrogenase-4 component F